MFLYNGTIRRTKGSSAGLAEFLVGPD